MNQNVTPLYVPPVELVEGDEAFEGDLFARKQLADRLTACINRFPNGGVIAIDAPWGEGKSWFGLHWCKKLQMEDYPTAYINAFELDYIEDPFTMLVGEILQAVNKQDKELVGKLKKTGITAAKAIAPKAGKFVVNLMGRVLVGQSDISDEFNDTVEQITEATSEGINKSISDSIQKYDENRKSVNAFKKTLEELAQKSEKPTVIFIDELDRCRPDFAVRTLERIKHFFEVENIVFVLLIHRMQLCEAIKGVYGTGVNAEQYLGKFIHLSLKLPKSMSSRQPMYSDSAKFLQHLLKRFNFSQSQSISTWVELMAIFAAKYFLSFRDLERAVVLLAYSGRQDKLMPFLSWPIILKLTKPQLFSEILQGRTSAHKEAMTLLNADDSHVSEIFFNLHQAHVNNFEDDVNEKTEKFLHDLDWSFNIRPSTAVLPSLFSLIDLDIQ
jgi:hypothetical protein